MSQVAQKEVLDDRIILTGLEIESINEVIDLYHILIIEKELEVVAAQNRARSQLEIYKTRVRSMEENGIITYLEILFDSTSFSDLLARWDFIADIMRADERLFANLQAARDEAHAAQLSLNATRGELEREKVQLESREVELSEQLRGANDLIEQIMDNLESEQALYDQVTEEAEKVQNDINRLVEEQRREEERRALAEVNRVVGTGTLMWPVNGPVTSTFGLRRHPVFGVQRMHSGIDIAAPHGTNVLASDTGTVIRSQFNSSYGHFIVINHGNGWTTLYAHLSSRHVEEGARVMRGQVIGRVGSTGISTGPHLHFEVSIGGSRVNPLRHL
jgi:murein DD-endopeptidase MepM/ murein hydrolase activator NlpD